MTDVLPGPTTSVPDGLAVTDLLADLTETVRRLRGQLRAGDPLDAYLLAAGAVQVVEDVLQRDVLSLRRVASYLEHGRGPAAAASLRAASTVCELPRRADPAHRAAARWADELARLRDRLAEAVIAPELTARPDPDAAERLLARLSELPPRVTGALLRLPSCFRSFDQQPDDTVELASRYAGRHPRREAPTLVVGIRTSGSYLAPLVAAALRAAGFADVAVASVRPGRRLRPRLPAAIRETVRASGRVVVVDDPPASGATVADVAERLTRCGIDAAALTLALPLFPSGLPDVLSRYDRVVLPWHEWAIHRTIAPDHARAVLAELLGGVVEVRSLPLPRRQDPRGHVRARLAVVLQGGEYREILAVGTGLGYFGRHADAVARALPGYLPRTYGYRDGLLFRDWLPEERRLDDPMPGEVATLAGYVAARARALPARADHSVTMAGQQPAWEIASRVLQRGYGRLGPPLRPILLDPAVRRLCDVARPSVVDGATGLGHWFRDGDAVHKVDADVRAFANTDLACYDPVYDLAGIAPGGADAGLVRELRRRVPSDDERFLLYELVHLWDLERGGGAGHRAAARAVQRYVATRLLAGQQVAASGPVCALDIDGVLESDAYSFPILTPLAALTLRTLLAHGRRPVPVTGRSLAEVVERCETYGLPGGVAEYGSVAYRHADGATRELVDAGGLRLLGRIGEAFAAVPDVVVEPDHRRSVRAYLVSGERGRRGLPPGTVEQVLARLPEADGAVRVIDGDAQTDIVCAGVDKGRGLRVLLELLGVRSGDGVELAAGDSEADLPMLAMAAHPYAPANAAAAVRAAGVRVTREAYAAGLARAVRAVVGHAPGACPVCRAPDLPARDRALLALLDAQRAGRRGLPLATLRALRAQRRCSTRPDELHQGGDQPA